MFLLYQFIHPFILFHRKITLPVPNLPLSHKLKSFATYNGIEKVRGLVLLHGAKRAFLGNRSYVLRRYVVFSEKRRQTRYLEFGRFHYVLIEDDENVMTVTLLPEFFAIVEVVAVVVKETLSEGTEEGFPCAGVEAEI